MRSTSHRVYRLVSSFNGSVSGLIFSASQNKAIDIFCHLHNLRPAQVAILYSYPLQIH